MDREKLIILTAVPGFVASVATIVERVLSIRKHLAETPPDTSVVPNAPKIVIGQINRELSDALLTEVKVKEICSPALGKIMVTKEVRAFVKLRHLNQIHRL